MCVNFVILLAIEFALSLFLTSELRIFWFIPFPTSNHAGLILWWSVSSIGLQQWRLRPGIGEGLCLVYHISNTSHFKQVSFVLLSIYLKFLYSCSQCNNKYYLLRFDVVMVIRVFKRLAARTLQPGSEEALCQVITICWTSHFQEMENLVPLLV